MNDTNTTPAIEEEITITQSCYEWLHTFVVAIRLILSHNKYTHYVHTTIIT